MDFQQDSSGSGSQMDNSSKRQWLSSATGIDDNRGLERCSGFQILHPAASTAKGVAGLDNLHDFTDPTSPILTDNGTSFFVGFTAAVVASKGKIKEE
jgi:hypothetical protein